MTTDSTEASNPIEIALSIVGTQAKLATALRESQQTISNWRKNGIPESKRVAIAPKLERVTEGRVTRQAVCPDDWRDIWPELAEHPVDKTAA